MYRAPGVKSSGQQKEEEEGRRRKGGGGREHGQTEVLQHTQYRQYR
jgi:hypothetical protein